MKPPRFVRRGSRPFLAPTFTVLTAAMLLAGCHRKAEAEAPKTLVAQNTVTPATAPATPVAPAPAPADPTPTASAAPAPMPPEFNWPRTYKDGTTTLLVYQPEIEKWDGISFLARFAVSIQEANAPVPTFGVIWVTATTNVDKEAGVVTLTNLAITKTNFPTETADNKAKYSSYLTSQLPAQTMPIPLAQISNRFQLTTALKQVAKQPVKNTVPRIIFSNQPALLVLVDGTPVMRPLAGTDYSRVFNTNALIVQAPNGGPYYLRALNYWFTSPTVEGPWTTDFEPIPNLPAVEQAAAAIPSIDPINPPQGQNPPAPDIYVSTVPTELIQTQGPPEFVPIRNTELLEVKNSDNAIILNIGDQLFYVLISGRWFSSPALTGQPWAYVPGDKLPADFAKIPPNSDKGNVLLSVPGTPQAQEAVIANSIPQTATVNRDQASLTVSYDGVPQFQPVEGTSLLYAVNTASPVIEVSPSSFYAVSNGVWFTSTVPVGPWAVATSVPPVIYSIPVSSPVHYVTYVQVYGYTDTTVTVGYTPGYYGTVVSPSGVVVYGSGYVYPPYVGTTVYVAPPATYGYGAGFSDGAATGFLFGFAAGAVLGACLAPSYGCWGTWGGNTYNTTINNGNVYNHWGNTVVAHGTSYNGNWHGGGEAGAGFNPYNGNWAAGQRGAGYNSATGTYGAGRSGAVGNAYTGNYAAGRQGAAYNPSTGKYAAGESGVEGNKYTGNFNGGRQGEVGNVNTGRSASGSTSFSGNAYNGNWNANQSRSYNDSKTGASASSTKTASGNAYNGTASSTTDRSATSANGSSINSTVDKSTGQPTTRSGSVYNANTGNTKDYDHTQGQGTQNQPTHAYSDSSGNVYKPSSSGDGYQKATSNGWQDTPKAQTPQNVQRQSQGWGGGNSGGGGGLTSGGWGDHSSGGGGFGGGGWGGGGSSDRWGGNDGGGGWGNRDSGGGGGGGWDRGGGGGGGGGFSRGGGGGRGWR